MENIDAIFYINLSWREDRRKHFEKEVLKLCMDAKKIHRIDAIYNQNGALGCALSHCTALIQFIMNPAWKTCIIFEDDFTFRNNDIKYNNNVLKNVFNKIPEWECFMLGAGVTDLKLINTIDDNIKKVISAQTASGYCITKNFAHVLLDNFREASELMQTSSPNATAHDQSWKILQPVSQWYTSIPSLGYQYEGYSDIEKAYVNYKC
jgi:glycosyl transferase family 25